MRRHKVAVERIWDEDGRLVEIQLLFTDLEGDTCQVDVMSEGVLFFHGHDNATYTNAHGTETLLECMLEVSRETSKR